MATQIVPFAQSKNVPAHIAKFVEDNANIDPKLNVPQLSFRGKVWRTVIDGEETPLMNAEDEPVSTVHVVVLDHNKARSRSYYEGAYEEGKAQAPACWSSDGDTPDASVKHPQSETCASCKQAVKGSKTTPAGKAVTACSIFKRVAVVPLSNLGSEYTVPLLLRLAQTSMWDKNNEDNEAKGYYAWDQYLDMLRARGATHTGVVATKIKFDSRQSYPKLVFAASRWLADEELEIVRPLFKSEAVQSLLKAPEPAVAARATDKKPADIDDDEGFDDAPPPPANAKKAKAAPPPADDDDEPPPPAVAKKAKAASPPAEEEDDETPPPAAVKKGKKAAPPVEEEEDDETPPPAAVKKGKKAAPPPAEEEEDETPAPAATKKGKKGNGLSELVEEWND